MLVSSSLLMRTIQLRVLVICGVSAWTKSNWSHISPKMSSICLHFGLFSFHIQYSKIIPVITTAATIITTKGNNNNSIFKWRYDHHIGNCNLGNCKLTRKKFWYFNGIRSHRLCVSAAVLLSYDDLFIGSRPICWVHLCPVNRMNPVNLHSKW